MRGFHRPLALLILGLLATGCSARVSPPPGGPGAVAPGVAVEQFLQLAAERDFARMGWYFGTAEGAILDSQPAPDVEQRMYALAHVLQHDGYVLGPEQPVPGRVGTSMRYPVTLTRNQRNYSVPFMVTRGPGGRWFVEMIDVEAITNVR